MNKPTSPQIMALAQQAEGFLRAGQPHKAVQTLTPVMRFAHKTFPALVVFARATASLGQHERAAETYRQALKIRPSDAPVRTEFALALKRSGAYESSLQEVRSARQTEPFFPRAVMLEADLLMDLDDQGGAVELLNHFEENAPENARTPDTMAHLCSTRLRLVPRHLGAEGLVEEAQKFVGDEQVNARLRAVIASRLAGVFDKLDQPDDAIRMQARSKELRDSPWDADAHTKRIRASIETWTAASAREIPKAEVDGSRLVFILGLPRSGSSLLEQMITRHPGANALGERNEITFAAGTIDQPQPRQLPIVRNVRRMNPEFVQKLAEHVLERYAKAAGNADGLLIDKQPFNFMHVPLLARLLPGCRVLHTTRDLRDVALSYYLQWFNAEHGQANSFESLGKYCQDYAEMMRAWRGLEAPTERPEILDVSYELLTREPEGVMRRVLDFLGLEWDESVLEHTKNERVVATASREQVRSELYTSSVGRWKRYESHMQPFIEHVREFLTDDAGA